jgi:hypothetical protein
MTNEDTFTYVEPELLPVLKELRRREPIFHTPEFGTTLADFANATDPTIGRWAPQDVAIVEISFFALWEQNPPIDAVSANWQIFDLGLRRLGPDTYLLTYTLHQAKRITRRSTIWQRSATDWRILYHQGTIVSAEENDN